MSSNILGALCNDIGKVESRQSHLQHQLCQNIRFFQVFGTEKQNIAGIKLCVLPLKWKDVQASNYHGLGLKDVSIQNDIFWMPLLHLFPLRSQDLFAENRIRITGAIKINQRLQARNIVVIVTLIKIQLGPLVLRVPPITSCIDAIVVCPTVFQKL
jgi:hypothetical protein